jgi:hypothetical protein
MGKVLGEQKATHLNTLWFADLRRGDSIELVDAPFGRIFLSVDVDVYKPESFRIAALLGAEVGICSQYIDIEDYNREMILAGAWQEAQQNCMYVLSSTNLEGHIIGPCETSEDLSGFIKRGRKPEGIYEILSADKRKRAYEKFPLLSSLNVKLYDNNREQLWGGGR